MTEEILQDAIRIKRAPWVLKILSEALKKAQSREGGLVKPNKKNASTQKSETDPKPDEANKAGYVYPSEYTGPKPIADQIAAIAEIFELDPAHALKYVENLPQLPEGAEGWFAVPSLAALAKKHFLKVTDPDEQYRRAMQMVYAKLAASRPLFDLSKSQWIMTQLRLTARTIEFLAKIAEMQPESDILIVAGQLGLRYRGRSVSQVREDFAADEYGFDPLIVGSIVLVHPERLVRWEELEIDCPGAELSSVICFFNAPHFNVVGVGSDQNSVFHPRENYGSASGFLPQG